MAEGRNKRPDEQSSPEHSVDWRFERAVRELETKSAIASFFTREVEKARQAGYHSPEAEVHRKIHKALRGYKVEAVLWRWVEALDLKSFIKEIVGEICSLALRFIERPEVCEEFLREYVEKFKAIGSENPFHSLSKVLFALLKNADHEVRSRWEAALLKVSREQPPAGKSLKAPRKELGPRIIPLLPQLENYARSHGISLLSAAIDILNTKELVQQFYLEYVARERQRRVELSEAEEITHTTFEQALNDIDLESARAQLWQAALADEEGIQKIKVKMTSLTSFRGR